ncbi:MAG TPA: GNAT family N-acetyltransferase [Steroidobacteraceae bacterium]|nr:GNAT family N-acetyltransferase [Steroidobacteraceae bacterium]
MVDTPFECLAHVRAFQPEIIPELRHAIFSRGGQFLGALSFYACRGALVVVNRLSRLPDEALDICAARMLAEHPAARSVRFNDLYGEPTGGQRLPIRSTTWETIDCTAVELPRSYDDYLQDFGPATRKNLRYCARRLERESPNVIFRILRRDEITHELVKAVVELNHRRMAAKGKTSGMDDAYTRRMAALCRSHGVACIATDGLTVLGGTLCSSVGLGWTLHVIAHDPKYNHVRLGLLCLLKSIEEAIHGGAQRFNFLWGASDYKLLFGGKPRRLRTRRYYRSWLDQALAFDDLRDRLTHSLRRRLVEYRSRKRATRK